MTTASARGSGTELRARVVQSLDHSLVSHTLPRQRLEAIEPAVGITAGQCAAQSLLRDTRDVQARLPGSLREVVGEIDVHPRHAHIIHTTCSGLRGRRYTPPAMDAFARIVGAALREDVRQMLEAKNERLRRRAEPEVTEAELRARVQRGE